METGKTQRRQMVGNMLKVTQLETQNYSQREKANVKISYLQQVFEKIPTMEMSAEEWEEFAMRSNELLAQLPKKEMGKPLKYRNYLKTLSSFRNFVRQQFKFVPKGFYLRIYLFLGIVLGLIFGAIFGKMAIGTLFGTGVGLISGTYFDKKSERQDKVL